MNELKIKIIRSNRKTFGMEIRADGLTVRVPLRASDAQIQEFIASNRRWLEKHLRKLEQQKAQYAEVLRVFPEYYKWDRWLRENGTGIMMRMTR